MAVLDPIHLHCPIPSLPVASGEGFSSGFDESKIKVIIAKMCATAAQPEEGRREQGRAQCWCSQGCAGCVAPDRHPGCDVLTENTRY